MHRLLMASAVLVLVSVGGTAMAEDDTLEIRIIASQKDMDNGFFAVEFRETIPAGTTWRELHNPSGMIRDSCMVLSIPDSVGSAEAIEGGIRYRFLRQGPVSYGYTIHPKGTPFEGSGFCSKDLGILDLYYCMPYGLQLTHDLTVVFDIPEGMRVYAPWGEGSQSGKVYEIPKSSPYNEPNLSLAAWASFSPQDSLVFDSHKLYMLSYQTDNTNVFRVMKYAYSYFMRVFENKLDFLPSTTLPPNNIAVVLPPPEDRGDHEFGYGSKGEGPGGFYMPNRGGDQFEPHPVYQEYQPVYLSVARNLTSISVTGIHVVAHATLHPEVDQWVKEGIAVYYQIDLLHKMGIIDDALREREFMEHLRHYLDDVVGTSRDRTLKGSYRFWTTYIKSALLYYAINEAIRSSSEGLELIDVWPRFYEEYRGNPDPFPEEMDAYNALVRHLTEMTGRDFREFFRRYVYDNQPLPLEIRGGFDARYDLNENDSVDFADFVIFARNFGTGGSGLTSDFNEDGKVDFHDFVEFASNFGKSKGRPEYIAVDYSWDT